MRYSQAGKSLVNTQPSQDQPTQQTYVLSQNKETNDNEDDLDFLMDKYKTEDNASSLKRKREQLQDNDD